MVSGELGDESDRVSSGIEGELGDPVVLVGGEGDEARANEPLSEEHDKGGRGLRLRRQRFDPVESGGARGEIDEEFVGAAWRSESEHDGVWVVVHGTHALASGVGEWLGEACGDVEKFWEREGHERVGFQESNRGHTGRVDHCRAKPLVSAERRLRVGLFLASDEEVRTGVSAGEPCSA